MDNAVRKNLIYFIYWQPSSEMLLLNLEQMNKYIHLFDGQRIIKIAGIDSLNPVVLKRFPWLKEARFVQNDPIYNERPHFIDSLHELDYRLPSHTFYCHAKGVSRVVNNPLKWWVQLMYNGNLGSEPNLKDYLFSGCFGKLRRGSDNVPVPWHYSGSFYWFDTVEVLKRFLLPYYKKQVPNEIWNRWFTESFPAWIAKQSEAEFKLHASAEKGYNCYSDKFWNRHSHLLRLL